MRCKTTNRRSAVRLCALSLLILTVVVTAQAQEGDVSKILDLTQEIATEQGLEVDTSKATEGMIAILVGKANAPKAGELPVFLGYEFKSSEGGVKCVRFIVVSEGNIHHVIGDLGKDPKRLKAMIGGSNTVKLHKELLKRSKKIQIRLEEAERQESAKLKSYLASLS